MSMFTATKPKTSKIGSAFSANASSTLKKLPARLGGVNKATFAPQQQAIANPMADNGAPVNVLQPDTIMKPQATQDAWEPTGQKGIAEQGIAATAEEQIKLVNREEKAELARQAEMQRKLKEAEGKLNFQTDAYKTDYSGVSSIPGLDGEQMQYAKQIAQMGQQRGFTPEEIQIALATALAESGLRNVNYGDRDSVGLYQQRTSQGWGSIQQIMDPNYSIGKFYDTLKGTAGPNPWQRAQNVQRSAFADGSNYKAQWGKAQQIWGAIQQGATTPSMKPNGSLSWINQNNNKYHDFDGKYGAQCVDLYNFYMTGFVGGQSSVGRVSYANELWTIHDQSALVRVAKNQKPRMGDIAIWDNSFNGQGGHVAIVAQDNGNGTIRVLNANATSAGSRGNTVMSNFSTGKLLGYLRPRKLM